MTAQWQRNQNGTYFSDYKGFRISVTRQRPRARSWVARIEGRYIATFSDISDSRKAAELAADQRAGE